VPRTGLTKTQTAGEPLRADETRLPRAGTPRRRSGAAPKTADSASAYGAAPPDGTVTGTPRRWLRLEGAVLLAGSLIAYSASGQPWWLVPLALLVPDVLMAGYLRCSRLGAQLYNLAHSTTLPAAMIGLGWWQSRPLILALGLIWLAHIGVDRVLGYGLKYDDHFQHTHLGHLGSPE
jgi:Domain of unknown function (DUF4260)